MGGCLQIIKRVDGQYWSHYGHTAQIANVLDPSFIENDSNQDLHTRFKRFNEKSSSFPAPEEYGLLVIDFDTKWLGSVQGYINPTTFNAIGMNLALQGQSFESLDIPGFFEKAWKRGWIKRFNSGNPPQSSTLESLGLHSLDTIKDFLLNNRLKRTLGIWDEFPYEPEGWTLDAWQSNPQDLLTLAKKMIDRSFPIESSLSNWQEYVQGCHVDEDDTLDARREASFIQDHFQSLVLQYQADQTRIHLDAVFSKSSEEDDGKSKSFL